MKLEKLFPGAGRERGGGGWYSSLYIEDFVFGQQLNAFEVKYRERPRLDKKSGLGTYCLSEKPKQAYLVTKRDVDLGVTGLEGIETEFLKIPDYILCYLLGQSERLLWE